MSEYKVPCQRNKKYKDMMPFQDDHNAAVNQQVGSDNRDDLEACFQEGTEIADTEMLRASESILSSQSHASKDLSVSSWDILMPGKDDSASGFSSKFSLYSHQRFSFQSLSLVSHGSAKSLDSPLPMILSSFQISLFSSVWIFTLSLLKKNTFIAPLNLFCTTLILGPATRVKSKLSGISY